MGDEIKTLCEDCKNKEQKKHCPSCGAEDFNKKEEKWYHMWRHWAAFIYLIICIFDFLGMPVFYELINLKPSQALELSLNFDKGNEQLTALQLFMDKRTWEPITLRSGGLFHLAFGAILGIASFTRGQEKIKRIK